MEAIDVVLVFACGCLFAFIVTSCTLCTVVRRQRLIIAREQEDNQILHAGLREAWRNAKALRQALEERTRRPEPASSVRVALMQAPSLERN